MGSREMASVMAQRIGFYYDVDETIVIQDMALKLWIIENQLVLSSISNQIFYQIN
jgi:hypothetical protein